MRRTTALCFVAISVLGWSPMAGQGNPQGKPITQADYERWSNVGGKLSDDGRWLVYTISPGVGNAQLVAKSTTGTTEYRYDLGYTGRPRKSGYHSGGGGTSDITSDSRWVVFTIAPPKDSVELARTEKRPAEKHPKSSLGIMDLTTGQVTVLPRVSGFTVPDTGTVISYTPVPLPAKPDSAKPDSAKPAPAAKPDTGAKKKEKAEGSTIILRDLSDGKELKIEKVTFSQFLKDGSAFVYVVSTKLGEGDGIFLQKLGAGFGSGPIAIATGAGNYTSMTFDQNHKQLVYFSDKAEYGREKPRSSLYYSKLDGGLARMIVSADSVGAGNRIVSGALTFTEDGAAFTFSIGPVPADPIPADSLAEWATFDLWHYLDPYLQPAQNLRADYFKNPSYQAIYWIGRDRWVKLGREESRTVNLSKDGKVGLAISAAPYLVQGMWGDTRYDIYLVNGETGDWKLIKKNLVPTGGNPPSPGSVWASEASLSPNGKYVLLFENRRWFSYNVATGVTVDLTGGITGIRFDDETDDHPAPPPPLGTAGWTKDDNRVLIHDRWDIWEIDPTGQAAPRCMTDGVGRKKHVTLRIHRLDWRETSIPTDKPVWLRAIDDETMATGIWEDQVGGSAEPRVIVMMDKQFGVSAKAKNAELYLASISTFREYPDLWIGPSLTSLTKVTNANPQQAEFRWGTAQLVRYKNAEGVPLKGILYKPDGFDPSKKYPMVVDIYEMQSQGLHQYDAPRAAGAAATSASIYVSKGYLVFLPDIVYRDGHPGLSAVSAVTAAVQSLIDSGFVDPKRIGLAGHSWGGYQNAFIATQTNMFAAIASGAPVSNMSSAYGGIRWGSGLNRSMQYERTQSRIGYTPWQRPDLYIENSTIFHIDRVQTPIMIMHNDQDGAVPWYQGIELYIALRREGKVAFFFNYVGDDHGAYKGANAWDWDYRQQQFFDHYLLGAPMPEWMAKGIPVDKKGRDQVPSVRK